MRNAQGKNKGYNFHRSKELVCIFFSKNRLFLNVRGQGFEALSNQFQAKFPLLFRALFGIAEGVGNGDRWDDAIGPHGFRDRDDGAGVDDGKAASLHLFDHRCAATSAGASGRGQDDRLNAVGNQFFGDLPAELLGFGDRCGIADGGVIVGVE